MQELFQRIRHNERAHHHGYALVLGQVPGLLRDMVEKHLVGVAVGCDLIDKMKSKTQLLYLLFEPERALFIGGHIVQLNILKAAAERTVESFYKRSVERLDGQNDLAGADVAHERFRLIHGADAQIVRDLAVMPLDLQHCVDKQRDDNDDDPGALGKAGYGDDKAHYSAYHGAECVYNGPVPPAFGLCLCPAHEHARL